jgi:RimJ/RimL family protein N-acetyltransferase
VLNLDQQIRWYENVVCDRRATDRFWAIETPRTSAVWTKGDEPDPPSEYLIGIGGLTGIQWENGLAEITLVLDPGMKGKGYGEAAFDLILAEAFGAMRLETVVAEVYVHNGALGFWRRMAEKRKATVAVLPRRKFWGGAFHDAEYFSFARPA